MIATYQQYGDIYPPEPENGRVRTKTVATDKFKADLQARFENNGIQSARAVAQEMGILFIIIDVLSKNNLVFGN